VAFRGLAARQSNQVGFGLTIQAMRIFPIRFLAIQRRFQVLLDECLACSRDGDRRDLQGSADLVV